MAPLIDMVFILLIFYIVSTSFAQDAGVAVDRPESRLAEAVTARYLPVAISKAGTVHVAGRVIGPEEAGPIREALRSADVRSIVIQADRDTPASLLLRVLDTCKAAGADSVRVAAIPR
jgi:biopolymer transport protein ExbD